MSADIASDAALPIPPSIATCTSGTCVALVTVTVRNALDSFVGYAAQHTPGSIARCIAIDAA